MKMDMFKTREFGGKVSEHDEHSGLKLFGGFRLERQEWFQTQSTFKEVTMQLTSWRGQVAYVSEHVRANIRAGKLGDDANYECVF